MKIYLSPSNQPHNKYVVGNTNEKKEMEEVAKLVSKELKNYNCSTKMATLSWPIGRRYDEAKGCDLYLAIHSNAGSATARGAEGFYHPQSPKSKLMTTLLVEEINKIAKHGSNRYSQIKSGMDYKGVGYGEVREPFKRHGIPTVLFEVDFHSNKTTARWIIDNKPQIAKAIAKAIVKMYGLKENEYLSPNKKLYYVQVGAFQYRPNADELKKKLEKDGYNVYIKQE